MRGPDGCDCVQGDGAGVGKGRQIAALFKEHFRTSPGRKTRGLWLSARPLSLVSLAPAHPWYFLDMPQKVSHEEPEKHARALDMRSHPVSRCTHTALRLRSGRSCQAVAAALTPDMHAACAQVSADLLFDAQRDLEDVEAGVSVYPQVTCSGCTTHMCHRTLAYFGITTRVLPYSVHHDARWSVPVIYAFTLSAHVRSPLGAAAHVTSKNV